MVIREILQAFDKEIAASKAATARMEATKARLLACCREEEPQVEGIAGRIEPCKTSKNESRPRRKVA